jgi:hypothetical protein
MAKEADLWGDIYAIQRFAELVAAAERKACALVCDEISSDGDTYGMAYSEECAAAIRARGNNAA